MKTVVTFISLAVFFINVSVYKKMYFHKSRTGLQELSPVLN